MLFQIKIMVFKWYTLSSHDTNLRKMNFALLKKSIIY